jgi:enoyl-CoA hydratase/carnithine racemase
MKDKECASLLPVLSFSADEKGSVADVYKNNFLENWSTMTKVRKPTVAAVSGFAVSLALPPIPQKAWNKHF